VADDPDQPQLDDATIVAGPAADTIEDTERRAPRRQHIRPRDRRAVEGLTKAEAAELEMSPRSKQAENLRKLFC